MRPWRHVRWQLTAVTLLLFVGAAPVRADSPGELFREGQQLMRSGNLAAALEQFEQLREQYPWDADYSLGRAQVLSLQGRDSDALTELEETTRLAPDYEDAWRLRYAILSRQPQDERRKELQALHEQASRRFPLASWWRHADDPPQWTVLIGAGHDRLSNDLPGWNNQFVEVQYDKVRQYRLGARLGRDERYDEPDYSLGLMASRTWPSGWFAGADVQLVDDAAFQPDVGFGVYCGVPFGDGWVGGTSYRRKEYPEEAVASIAGTLEKYAGNFRFAYTLNSSHLQGASSFMGHAFTTNWYFTDDASVGLTFNTGKEAELLGNGQVLESDVSGVSLTGRYRFGERYGLQWWLGTHDQGDFYRRQSIGMAVSIRL